MRKLSATQVQVLRNPEQAASISVRRTTLALCRRGLLRVSWTGDLRAFIVTDPGCAALAEAARAKVER